MKIQYTHLGIFSDWVEKSKDAAFLYPSTISGEKTKLNLEQVLGFQFPNEYPQEIRIERTWEKDGIHGEEISWSVGYGPRTMTWFLKPAASDVPLPGIIVLHDHGDFKYFGKEKVALGPDVPLGSIYTHWNLYYGNRAYANELAREGFAVLVHDVFLWGSRKFPLNCMPNRILEMASTYKNWFFQRDWEEQEIAFYNAAALIHENFIIEKYCNLLGTTLDGVINYEDRVAFNFLASRNDVIADRCGCIGLSGGGARTALLHATSDHSAGAVVVGLMSTYPGMLDHNVDGHSWIVFPAGWSRFGDLPDIASCKPDLPLLVLYDEDDELFDINGMLAADHRIQNNFASAGYPENYSGRFFPGPHKFDKEMQYCAFEWLKSKI